MNRLDHALSLLHNPLIDIESMKLPKLSNSTKAVLQEFSQQENIPDVKKAFTNCRAQWLNNKQLEKNHEKTKYSHDMSRLTGLSLLGAYGNLAAEYFLESYDWQKAALITIPVIIFYWIKVSINERLPTLPSDGTQQARLAAESHKNFFNKATYTKLHSAITEKIASLKEEPSTEKKIYEKALKQLFACYGFSNTLTEKK